jgi:tRNA pseudouridine55 synthase
VDGFINLKKLPDWTSHDCVAKVRRILNMKKVGHGGTLDPAAVGVLPIAIGKATRLLQYLPEGKAYRAVIRFGIETTTDDLAGEVIYSEPLSNDRSDSSSNPSIYRGDHPNSANVQCNSSKWPKIV